MVEVSKDGVDRYLAGLFSTVFAEFCDGSWEVETHDMIVDGAVKAGLIECVDFDPDVHVDNDGACEPGDAFYQITDTGRAVLARARAALSDTPTVQS